MLRPLLLKTVAVITGGKLKAAKIVLLEAASLKLTAGAFDFLIRYLGTAF